MCISECLVYYLTSYNFCCSFWCALPLLLFHCASKWRIKFLNPECKKERHCKWKQTSCVAQWECCFFFSPLLIYCVHACLRSNPPPRQVPPNNKLSQRRHSLHKDNVDKPADGSMQGITGSEGWGGPSRVGAASCSSADLHWPPLSFCAALDGVPFSLHPKFDVQPNSAVRLSWWFNTQPTISLSDAVLSKSILSF